MDDDFNVDLAELILFPKNVDSQGQGQADLLQIAQKTFKCELLPGTKIISAYRVPVKEEHVFPIGMRFNFTLKDAPGEIDLSWAANDISYAEWAYSVNGKYYYGSLA